MRALVTTAGDSSRLPGPPPKSFRLIAGVPVVGWILRELEECNPITRIDVIVRQDQAEWAQRAIVGNYECDLILQPTLSLPARIRRAREDLEPLVICLGDTLVQHHADEIQRVVAGAMPRARVLAEIYDHTALVDSGSGLTLETIRNRVHDLGSYYIPEGFPLAAPDDEEHLLSAMMQNGPVDPVHLTKGSHWHDVGTPEGFAAAELALMDGNL